MNNDKKTLNAVRLHLILINEVNEAVRFKLIEIIKQRNANKTNCVKDFLIEHKSNASPYLDGFRRTLREKFNNDLNRYPNDLNDFDITDCFKIAKHCLHLQGENLQPFDDLREMRNKYYGHLSLISIEDCDYRRVLSNLKAIIQTLTQSDLSFQQKLKIRINQIEAIQSLSHLNSTYWTNLNEIMIGLVRYNKEMFQKITLNESNIDRLNLDLKETLKNELDLISKDMKSHINEKLLFVKKSEIKVNKLVAKDFDKWKRMLFVSFFIILTLMTTLYFIRDTYENPSLKKKSSKIPNLKKIKLDKSNGDNNELNIPNQSLTESNSFKLFETRSSNELTNEPNETNEIFYQRTTHDQELIYHKNDEKLKYENNFEENKIDNHVTYLYKNGNKYEGHWQNGGKHGKGTYTWLAGDKYEGDFALDQMNGYGIYMTRDGNKYEGEWKNDKRHGNGIHFYSSGNKYEGQWQNGEKHGKGIFTWPNGEKYEGEWINDKRHGHGIHFHLNGNIYEGEWKHGEKNGKGTLTWLNGLKYEGGFSSDKMNGYGIYISRDGNKYEGEWKNDKRHGNGIHFYSSGNKYEGQWQNGEKHGKGIFTWLNGDRYEGDFSHDKMNGQGIYFHKNGEKYDGDWREDRRHGWGIFIRKDGVKYAGEWLDGIMKDNNSYTFSKEKQCFGL